MDKFLRNALITMCLLIGIGIFYHYVVYLPGVEKRKFEVESEKNRIAEERDKQTKLKYEICMSQSRRNYLANWAIACQMTAKMQKESLVMCLNDRAIINNQFMGENYCKKEYIFLDSSPDCALPGSRADSIEEIQKKEQDTCLTEARAGL